MGGSVGGRLSARRMEVRDGHLLAFLPRTTAAPNSRLKLTALSVMPVMGAGQANTLVLSRAARVMMVLKVSLYSIGMVEGSEVEFYGSSRDEL